MSNSRIERTFLWRSLPRWRAPEALRWTVAILGSAIVLALLLLAHAIPPFHGPTFAAATALTALGLGVAVLHVRKYPIEGLAPATVLRILLVTSILAVGGMQIVAKALGLSGDTFAPTAYLLLTPLIAMGLLIGALLGPRMALVSTALPSLALGFTEAVDPLILWTAWLTAAFAAHAVTPLRQRSDVLRAAQITVVAAAVVASASAWYAGAAPAQIALAAGWAAIAGFVATCLFWLTIALFERAFSLVSDWTLHELCSPEQPLLRELLMRAPGTYAHSVMVGNLAEHAAAAIGANALLCRTMAYYHDIGKMNRPDFFIENNRGENPHERLSPSLSARVIEAHVRDGLELAHVHKLPQPILDAIEQHHGTSLITYFFHKAAQSGNDKDPAVEQHYRYAGPRPKTKETAILMLADRVEAAARALKKQNPGRLRSLIWEIVQDVRDDGQLDDSELHFRDLQTIVDSFVATLSALTHERLPYPTEPGESVLVEAQNPDDEQDEAEAAGAASPHGFGSDA